MTAELVVYALVAAGLVFWLRSILGTRGEDEPHHPMPMQDNIVDLQGDNLSDVQQSAFTQEDKIAELSSNKGIIGIDNKTAENGLLDISKADKSFDVEAFLEAAQDAFVFIVESFADGDRETLQDLLSEDVYKAFDGALVEREKSEEKQESEIHAIRKAEIIEAQIKGKTALVTVRFIADETSVTYDKDGEITAGHPDKVTEMKDIWVFGRDIKSRDPRWFVMETRGDFEGDNETVPNSDE